MKTIKNLLLLIVALFAITLFSCRKTHGNSTTNSISSLPKYEKRWNISDSLSHRPAVAPSANKGTFLHAANKQAHRPEQDSLPNYSAIEFLINSYVIFFQDGSVQVGQYTATSDTTLVLDSVGTIYITSISSATFSFVLVPNDGAAAITITATAANPIGNFTSASDAAFISNTWKFDSIVDPEFPGEDLTEGDVSYAVFSEYGTYLIRDTYDDSTEDYETNTWQWSNSSHNQLCYGEWDGQNITSCDGLGSVKVVSFAAPYTKLVLQETDTTDAIIYYLSKQ